MKPHLSISDTESVASSPVFVAPLYERWLLRGTSFPFVAHFLRFAGAPAEAMWSYGSQDALDLDFSKEATRPDVPGKPYSGRPGVYLSKMTRAFRDVLGPCVAFNGNNLGHWGNQFLIINGRLSWKRVPALFCDNYVSPDGRYLFLCQDYSGTYSCDWLEVELAPTARRQQPDLSDGTRTRVAPYRVGISGFPLTLRGASIWAEHITQAWDPKLVYHLNDLSHVPQAEIPARLEAAHRSGSQLQRHGLTFLALDRDGRLCVLAVEEHEGSRGINLREAATLLIDTEMECSIVLGGKGDVQLVSSDEGVLIKPLISHHDRDSARRCDSLDRPLSPDYFERPLPCFIVVGQYSGIERAR